jgi:hypothetical protein
MNNSKKVGRPINSVTTVKVRMIDLLRVVSPEAEVCIGRKYADAVGILDKCFVKNEAPQFQFDTLFD